MGLILLTRIGSGSGQPDPTQLVMFFKVILYKFLLEAPHILSSLQHIWKIKAPPRIFFFTRLRLRNAIFIIDNLKKGDWQLVNVCQMCFRPKKRSNTFSECEFAKELRKYIYEIVRKKIQIKMHTGKETSCLFLMAKYLENGKGWR
jgi:zinc-binding in reverse transcriptase